MTTQAKHTPGPYRVVKRANQLGLQSLKIDTGKLSGGVWGPIYNCQPLTAEHEAIAVLFAAAPALLEALQACADKLERVSASARGDNGHSEHTLTVLQQARAAIQSATLNQ